MSRSLLGLATWLAAGVGAVCVMVAGVVGGGRGARSAAVAALVALGFLWFGQLPVAMAARGQNRMGALLLLLGYTLRVAVGVLALRLLFNSAAFDRRVFGVSVILCALAWTAGAVWSFVRHRSVTIELDLPRTTDV